MYFQTFEDNRADSEQYKGDNPEIHRQIKVFKEPHLIDQTVPISLYNVEKRIQFQQF